MRRWMVVVSRMVNLVSRSAHLCLWSARARVAGRAKPQVECGPGLALLGVEVQAGLLPQNWEKMVRRLWTSPLLVCSMMVVRLAPSV